MRAIRSQKVTSVWRSDLPKSQCFALGWANRKGRGIRGLRKVEWLISVFFRRQAAEFGECPAEAEQAEVEQVRSSDEVQHPHSSN